MLKIIVEKWNKNKQKLEKVFREDNSSTFNNCEYLDLVKLAFNTILNDKETLLDIEGITEIDNGDYQGTLLYLIPFNTYHPSEYEYLMTYVGYGSCSGCDTLQAIQDWGEDKLSEQQISDFMELCKDILTNTIKPYDCGWRADERFAQVELQEAN